MANFSICGPLPLLSTRLKIREHPNGSGDVANLPICAPFLMCSATFEGLGVPKWQGFHEANVPICGGFLIFFPLFESRPTQLRVCSVFAHLWATFDVARSFEAVRTSNQKG